MYAEDKRFYPDALPLSLAAADALWTSYPRPMRDESFWGPRPRLRCVPRGAHAGGLSFPDVPGVDVLRDARAAGDVAAAAAGGHAGGGGGQGGAGGGAGSEGGGGSGIKGGKGAETGSAGSSSGGGNADDTSGFINPSTTSSSAAHAAALAAATAVDPATGSRLVLPSEAVGCAARIRASLGQGAVVFVAVDAPRLQQLLLATLQQNAFITPGVGVDPTNVFRDGDGATGEANVHYPGQVRWRAAKSVLPQVVPFQSRKGLFYTYFHARALSPYGERALSGTGEMAR
jgi:hypothetical protein